MEDIRCKLLVGFNSTFAVRDTIRKEISHSRSIELVSCLPAFDARLSVLRAIESLDMFYRCSHFYALLGTFNAVLYVAAV